MHVPWQPSHVYARVAGSDGHSAHTVRSKNPPRGQPASNDGPEHPCHPAAEAPRPGEMDGRVGPRPPATRDSHPVNTHRVSSGARVPQSLRWLAELTEVTSWGAVRLSETVVGSPWDGPCPSSKHSRTLSSFFSPLLTPFCYRKAQVSFRCSI